MGPMCSMETDNFYPNTATEKELHMDPDSNKEELPNDDENDKLSPHQESSSHFEDSKDTDQLKPDGCKWQTRRN